MEIILILDYIGTFAFAVSGAMLAVEKEMDIIGLLILASFTGIGGGILRDIIIGKIPPTVFSESEYFYIIFIATILVFFFYKFFKELEDIVVIGDAIGLGTFTIIGIEKALAYNMNILSSIIMGVITPTFGGMIRDVLANRIPFILKSEIYLSLCILGGLIFFIMRDILSFDKNIIYFVIILIVSGIRIVAYFKKWNLPRVKLK
ncbi:MAG TPA: trimeric intracellular cation channel family protein [Spirochaetota bacterium]|nr:trimeric intracellular cation channel family protein [Spirochaetota bacterium]HOM38728.1 trimeric intracellular cation channel family protein [Spirochaetota bacterium]HPQ49525.1 trimeric intracellular cation channel family protein [Spirochaetota bacterium]